MNSAAWPPVSTPPMPLRVRSGKSFLIICAIAIHLASAMGRTALYEYPPGVLYPSTQGSGARVSRLTPMMDMMVLIAAMPSMFFSRQTLAGSVMSVMFGVILAHTGTVATSLTHPHTSSSTEQSWPIAAPIFRSGMPCGHEKLISKASTPTSSQRLTISTQFSFLYSSIMDAMRMRSGYSSLSCLNSASMTSKDRSEMSSMFCQPITSLPPSDLSLAYLGVTFLTRSAFNETVLAMTPPQPSSKAFFITV
mmetsp:Transcript_7961/g.22018  ORF Transcript_7961/g.22018 Transcript_7961/m.22018 type:complete len:250 (-) Transcript_7961:360-1109(-)